MMTRSSDDPRDSGPELWGGAECTIVRVGDMWRDQSVETGHRDRRGDVDRIAGLGIRRLRFPILWESVAPDRPDRLDFSWTDDRLAMLRERGIDVIAGLLHHGSGPHHTHLLDPDFPKKLGDYAERVAERYPWIDHWTPVNEPLTTARFAGLYGHWYPHRRDYRSFLRALANQCMGTLEAMRAIRAVNPAARLVQTEDLGKTFSTAPLAYQARHENERRWLSFDLLCGRVGAGHPMTRFLRGAGVEEAMLDELGTGEARPDIIGINHYLTSERFIDHRTDLYPGLEPGGNGRHSYVDAEAVRVKRLHGRTGIAARLREAWARYHLPIAVTEVHHGCTRDEQLRWFVEVWETARRLRTEGVDVTAVTAWSMFGNVDWRSLITRRDGDYDPGLFDVRGATPRPTIVASAAKAFASGQRFDHPVLDAPGWWRRPERLYPWHGRCRALKDGGRRLLITGATGTLGRAFARICEHRGLPYCLTDRTQLEIADETAVRKAIDQYRPWAIINAAGFVRVADAERERESCLKWNVDGAARLAEASAEAGLPLVTFSSDLVFDGRKGAPYVETDEVRPDSVYGLSKARAEEEVASASNQALIIRTSAFFGPWDGHNFARHVLDALARGESFRASATRIVSPTYVPDLCHAAIDLLIDGETGIRHLANTGALSWHAFARIVAGRSGYDAARILPIHDGDTNTALASERGFMLRPVAHAIDAFLVAIGERCEAPVQDIAAE